ncbi:MAG: hypothetical protein DRJ65_05860 [Acidobacteria bacterium]|nr:MAG: hypothetical protein DRJ65_05860 [Acidobacteriota bacterium]
MGLADIVQWLAASRKTGTLIIDGTDFTKKIFFRRGDVVAVASDNPREYLGHYLVGWGHCTPTDVESMIESQNDKQMMLGELAITQGFVSPEEFQSVLIAKTRETLYDLILWDSGDFRFIESDLPDRAFHEVPLPAASFLFEGHRQRDERLQMTDLVPDTTAVPVSVAVPEDLNDEDMALVMQMDGRGTIEELALWNRRQIFDVIKLVHRCVKSGLMQVRPSDHSTPLADQISAPWKATERNVMTRLERGRFLDALRLVTLAQEKYDPDPAVTPWASAMLSRIQQTLEEEGIKGSDILELGIDLDDLVKLDCDPAEGFVLSRITGMYTIEEVLNLLPGSDLNNRVIIHNLIRRGLVKAREFTSVKRFQNPTP